jgi:hypothetical protein
MSVRKADLFIGLVLVTEKARHSLSLIIPELVMCPTLGTQFAGLFVFLFTLNSMQAGLQGSSVPFIYFTVIY